MARVVFIKKLIDQEATESENPLLSRSFNYREEAISHDEELVAAAQDFADNEMHKENNGDIEVFEVRGNHIFTSLGVYFAEFGEVPDENIIEEDEFN
jgi:hypothetical protein